MCIGRPRDHAPDARSRATTARRRVAPFARRRRDRAATRSHQPADGDLSARTSHPPHPRRRRAHRDLEKAAQDDASPIRLQHPLRAARTRSLCVRAECNRHGYGQLGPRWLARGRLRGSPDAAAPPARWRGHRLPNHLPFLRRRNPAELPDRDARRARDCPAADAAGSASVEAGRVTTAIPIGLRGVHGRPPSAIIHWRRPLAARVGRFRAALRAGCPTGVGRLASWIDGFQHYRRGSGDRPESKRA